MPPACADVGLPGETQLYNRDREGTAECNSSLPVSMPLTGFWVRLCAYWNSLVVMA